MRLMIRITTAITRRMWMKPPIVYDVTSPRSQRTIRITKMVQSVFFLPLHRNHCAKAWNGTCCLPGGRTDNGDLFNEGFLPAPRHPGVLRRDPEAALRALRRLRQERQRPVRRARIGCPGEAAYAVGVGAEAALRLGVERNAAPRGLLWKSDEGRSGAGSRRAPPGEHREDLRLARGVGEGIPRDGQSAGDRLGGARLGPARTAALQRLDRRARPRRARRMPARPRDGP